MFFDLRKNMGECPYEQGGYFIIDGQEKVIVSHERKAENKLYIVKSEVYMNKKITKLNLIGLKCPFPVLKTMKKLKEIPNNQYLEVVTDDFDARKDFQELNNNGKILLIDLKKIIKIFFS